MAIGPIENPGDLERFILDRVGSDLQYLRNRQAAMSTAIAASAAVHALSNSQASLSGTVNVSGAGIVQVVSTNPNAFLVSATTAQSVQTQGTWPGGIRAISASDSVFSNSTVRVTGAGNVTVASDASGAVVSGSQSVQTQNLVGAISNSQASRSGVVNVSGAGAVAVGTQTGNAFTISAPAQSVQSQAIQSIAASDATYTSGQVQFTGSNAATVKSSANQRVVVDVPTQTVQPVGSASAKGNTAGTLTAIPLSGNLGIAGGPNITISQKTDAESTNLTISGGAGGGGGVARISASDSTFDGTVRVTGGPGVVVGTDASGVSISASAQTEQTQKNIQSIAASDTTYHTGSVQFTGSNMVTVKSSANQRVVIDATQVPQTVQTQQNIQSIAASDTTYHTGQVQFTGSGDVTVKSSANQRVVIEAPAQTEQTQNRVNVSISNNASTSGALAHISSGTLSLVAGPNITLSQNANTVAISAAPAGGGAAPTVQVFRNMAIGSEAAPLATAAVQAAVRSVLVQPLVMDFAPFPGNMTVNTMMMPLSLSGSTATMSAAHTSIFRFGFYTNNAGTLSLVNSASTSFGSGAANANLSTQFAGARWLTLGTAAWSSSPVFSGAQYWWAFHYSTAGVSNQSATIYHQNLHASNSTSVGTIGAASVANSTHLGIAPFYGAYSATTAALPASILSNQLNKQVALGVAVPSLMFNNISVGF